MSEKDERPIIVKRRKAGGHGHHGGAWKIAYADFMTAMMAFFLLMWLLSSVSSKELTGIAEYFRTPLKVALTGGRNAADNSGVIPGGGTDTTRTDGQKSRGDQTRSRQATTAEMAERADAQRLRDLKARIEKAIESNPTLKQFRKQLLIDVTTEGLRIQIVDDQNRPMFANASAQVQPYMRDILREIGKSLNGVPNSISLSGHTDATAYAQGDKSYSNWELSADRANASRRELIAGGLDGEKVLRVVGLASTVPLDRDDAYNPINRRISIIVLNRRAEQSVKHEVDQPTIDAANARGAGSNAVSAAMSGEMSGGPALPGLPPLPAPPAAPTAPGASR
ncbi:flagellar motor protein MotB [Pandoraea anapnoica]|uniref:Flagellar motor protein MotB n=1 Tax=Pandoraea anapnoica TaxID=2508301 RepID=A0A5E4ZY46_9BURK|nr:flagellar motor protein MotB [Pandoraea anapnoica]VVE66224.1 flagellar motor protein MotB [Pandoraea anapnoica]